MSTPIQRYDIYPGNYQTIKEETDPTGEWVKYDDHAAALARRDQRIAELEGLLRRSADAIEGVADNCNCDFSREVMYINAEGMRAALATPEPRDAGGDE